MNWFLRSLLCLALAAVVCPARADDTAAATGAYKPASTVVAILPVVNQSGAKDDMQAKQTAKAKDELAMAFTDRGFKVADPVAVDKAISDLKIDFKDEDSYHRETFYKIGKAVGANLVAFLMVEDASQGWHNNGIMGRKREGKAKLKMWLVDADQEKPILNAARTEAKSSGNYFVGNFGGSEFTVRAIGNGVKDLLKDFFKPYPEVKKDDKK